MIQALKKDNELLDDEYLQFMSLSLGNIELLALQSSVISIDGIQDIDYEEPSIKSVGWVNFDNHRIPVYSFTERFDLEQSISNNNKKICAVLKDEDIFISLMCLEATSFRQQIVKLTSLPECMQAQPSPIDSLCLCRNDNKSDVGFIITTKSIVKYINQYATQ